MKIGIVCYPTYGAVSYTHLDVYKRQLYFHHPDFFTFVVGEDNLASSYFPTYQVPFIVNKINDSELDLEFLNTFKTVDNTNGLYTVSYTHLDVYKRQMSGCERNSRRTVLCEFLNCIGELIF